MNDRLEIKIGAPTTVDENKTIAQLATKLQNHHSPTLAQWVTGEYLKTRGNDLIKQAANRLRLTLSDLLIDKNLSTFCQMGPAKNILRELRICQNALILNLTEGIDKTHQDLLSVTIAHSSHFDPSGFRVFLFEPTRAQSLTSILRNSFNTALSIPTQVEKRTEELVYFYTPEATGCDQISLYDERRPDLPAVNQGRIIIEWFKPSDIGNEVGTYVDKRGVLRFTGATDHGARLKRQKAAYFGLKILSHVTAQENLISFPKSLLEKYLEQSRMAALSH